MVLQFEKLFVRQSKAKNVRVWMEVDMFVSCGERKDNPEGIDVCTTAMPGAAERARGYIRR